MDGEAELRQQFIAWLENCRLRLANTDGRERLRAEMVAIAKLLAAQRSTDPSTGQQGKADGR